MMNWNSRSLAAVWHPCTQMKGHEEIPLLAIKRGKGAFLYDHQDKAYLDSISSWWTNLFGHANPFINQAITDQLNELEHVMLAGMTHEPAIILSEQLSALTHNNLGHAFYGSDGASAVEIALKMSFHYWRNLGKVKKTQFVCLANSYHGETLGALSVTDIPIFSDTYSELLRSKILAPSPDLRLIQEHQSEEEFTLQTILKLEEILSAQHGTIAALIIEPMVQCATGMAMHSSTYLKSVRGLCDKYQILLIADEIAVGFGRTGTFFASEHADIWPDLMTLSKGLTGGYLPLSVVLSRDKIYQAFYSNQTSHGFLHSHSYTGNPLACRSALATLELFKTLGTLQQNCILARQLGKAFDWVQADSRLEHFRQLGTILAFDVKKDLATPYFSKLFFAKALEKGLLIRPIANTVYVMPPYILTEQDCVFLGLTVQICLDEILRLTK